MRTRQAGPRHKEDAAKQSPVTLCRACAHVSADSPLLRLGRGGYDVMTGTGNLDAGPTPAVSLAQAQ